MGIEHESVVDHPLPEVFAWHTRRGAMRRLGVVSVRTGIVQSARGGTLRMMRPLFAAGLGGRIGGGLQWVSWIGLDDLLDVYYRALYDTRLVGPVNAVAPAPVRNADSTKALARVLHRPALLSVPSLGPKLLLGTQGARELAETDQRVVPTKLETLGHRFRRPRVEDALAHELGHGGRTTWVTKPRTRSRTRRAALSASSVV